ncbi:hypothetical protein [Bosea massiliensis]|uniref:DUF2190 family protein n=1 Tax=Bosea massiliensis TaxID=151419 RepID=A0ABW0PA58_9HYPH
MPTAFNAAIATGSSYAIPAGKTAEFHAFPVLASRANVNASLAIGAVQIAIITDADPIGPLHANAGDVVSWTGANGAALSGTLTDVA